MATNFLDQLAELEVPPPPPQFDAQLHARVNRSLLTTQLLDLVLRAFPWAIGHFARAGLGFFIFTVTGRYERDTKHKERRR